MAIIRLLIALPAAVAAGLFFGGLAALAVVAPFSIYNLHAWIAPAGVVALIFGSFVSSICGRAITHLVWFDFANITSRRAARTSRRTATILIATLAGLAAQGVVLIVLWFNPPSSIQGPGPFLVGFPAAGAVAAWLSYRGLKTKAGDAARA
jgi:dolichol kinase